MVGAALRQEVTATALAATVEAILTDLAAPSPRVVINGTGIVVHTNLGRSVLSHVPRYSHSRNTRSIGSSSSILSHAAS